MQGAHYTDDEQARGIVFDVQRFALHDGPGIRTTVFLKGCPLSCIWCHNPESRSFRLQLSFDPDACTHCLECVDVCPTGALMEVEGTLVVRHDLCSACGKCPDVCVEEALSIIGAERTAGEVIDEIERDRAYFERSGGGITLSGGEPLAQPGFALALLRLARSRGLHTCLDTSGAVHPSRLQDALPYTDLFLFDYKASGSGEHELLTGVSNGLILENLDYLYEKEASILLRCPLVQGVNDSTAHLTAIAEIGRRYPRLFGIEVMAYHSMGRDKARRIGCSDALDDLSSADEATKARWIGMLHALGCVRAAIG